MAMAKTWVLETETKGTGARVVPLEKAGRRPGPERELSTFTFKRDPAKRAGERPAPAPALRFRVTDVLGARELARDIDARATIALLEHMRSVLDARVHVWMPSSGRWRLLTLDEHKLLWRFRELPELAAERAEVRP
jgi:hypothetical protein